MAKLKLEELIMEITRVCNLDCGHCFRGESQNAYMDINTIRNLMSNIESIDHLVLSGGEPLIALHQLFEVADTIHRNGIRVDRISVITNGTVLSSEIIRALEMLREVCKELSVRISDDKFHRMALDRKNLKNRRNVNYALLNKLFGATLYGTPRREQVISLIESVGRAKNLTDEDMKKVNEYGDYQTYYTLTDSDIFGGTDLTVDYKAPYYAGNLEIKERVNIDVNGYLADGYASYEESDSHNIDECNINNVSLLEAVKHNSERVCVVKQKRLK